MAKKNLPAPPPTSSLPGEAPAGYGEWLVKLKADIRQAQMSALVSVNSEMIRLYWRIGRDIIERQDRHGWGASVIPKLATDLRTEFPDVKGFSARNLSYMKAFATAWPHEQILQTVFAKLPWSHTITILDKLDDETTRLWYANAAIERGWSVRFLAHQIDTRLDERDGRALNNFSAVLPPPDSDMAKAAFKDQYVFDFIELEADAHERRLEAKLIERIRDFLLELGAGFAFIGSQYHLEVGGQDFYLDLLFYHTKLHRYVVIDLKVVDFVPEFSGKMSFYLSVVDEKLKTDRDDPSIGLVLCRRKNETIVGHALKGVNSPMVVSDYYISLPPVLAAALPDVAKVEAGLDAIVAESSAELAAEEGDSQ